MAKSIETSKGGENWEQLLAKAASGSEAALRSLYNEYGGLVYSVAYKILEDAHESEEATQDVFVKVWRLAGGFDRKRSTVKGWICMIARSTCLDRLRKRKRRPDQDKRMATDLSYVGELSEGIETALADAKGRLAESLAVLRTEHRVSIELAYFKGYTQREIAEALNIPEGTAKTFLRRGLLKLREVFSS